MGITVLGLAGSARRDGNTETLLDWCLGAARAAGATVIKFRLSELKLHGCRACDACWKDGVCVVKDDMQQLYPYLREADSIVLAAPVYFMGMPAVAKMMIDRCQCFWALKYVLGQSLVEPGRPKRLGAFLACSGTGVPHAFEGSRRVMQAWWHLLEVVPAGELTLARIDAKGDILKRPEAKEGAERLGRRLAEREAGAAITEAGQ